MDTTDFIAIYAAIVATGVLIWDIYKWKRSGPQIIFGIRPNMLIYGDNRYSEEDTYITTSATNKGDLPTTLNNLGLLYYKNRLLKILRRPDYTGVVGKTGLANPIPYTIEPGKVWNGLIKQTDEIEEMARKGLLICELYLSHSKKPKKARVILKRKNNK